MAFDAQMQADLNAIINRLNRLEPFVRKNGQADMVEAAKFLAAAVKGRTPVGTKAHKRYPKLGGRKKAAKGSGKVLATYRPGNLRRSMQVLKFRRSAAAFVGAKLGNKTADGYYAHMVERGTNTQNPQYYFKAAVSAAGTATLRIATQLIQRRISSFAKTNGF